jgi:LysM repeat protein
MKAFTVLFLLLFVFLVVMTFSFSNLDLTPDNGPVVQGSSQQAPQIPLAPTPGVSSAIPLQQSAPQTNQPGVEVQAPASGIPVTGGAGTCPVAAVPVTGSPCPVGSIPLTGNCGVQYIPVTGGCGVSYVPVTGVPVTGIPVSGYCSNPYVVNYGDTLSKIARACGTTVSGILALNPAIANANVIHPGQVLWLYAVTAVPNVPVTGVTPAPTVTVPVNPIVLNPSIVPVPAGTSLQVSVSNFPANSPVNIGIGRPGIGYQVVNTGITDAFGSLRTTAVVPAANDPQEQWVIMVVTTSAPHVQMQSAPFTIVPAQ